MKPPAPARGILAAGNFIVDTVKLIDRWPAQDALTHIRAASRANGGGPYNVLKDLARLGARYPLAALGRLGDDEHGAWIRHDCAAHGIDTAGLRATPGTSTSYTDVMTVQSDARRTFFHHAGANAALTPADFAFTPGQARIFYLGYLLLLPGLDAAGPDGRPGAAGVLARARAAGLRTALDCVSEDGNRFDSVVSPVLPEVDLLFANDFEAEKITGRSLGRGATLDREAMAAAARDLLQRGVREFVVIHCPEGVCAAGRDGQALWQSAVAVPPAAIAGAAGAGDALAAGVLHACHEGWSIAQALELGVCTAAASLGHASCSDAIGPVDTCLALGRRWGFRT
jgi:sugar/nucleoside kinase (ribokinase family)